MANEFDPYYQWLGIPPKFQPPNHYRLLSIEEFEANPDVIENAADRQIAHVRLFQSGPQGEISQRLLNEITAAKLCLLNKERKAEYDGKLRADREAAEAAARPQARAVRVKPTAPTEPAAAADPSEPFDEGQDILVAPSLDLPGPSLSLPTPGSSSISSGLSLSSANRRRAKSPGALIGGVAAGGLVLAVLAFLVLRGSGTPTVPKTIAEKTLAQVDPIRKTIIESRKSEKTTAEAPRTEIVGTKTPPERPDPKADPPPEGPDGSPYALQFKDRDYVEIADTAEMAAAEGKEYVWIEDEPPPGVRLAGDTPWEWVTKPQPVFSGKTSTRRSSTTVSQHFFLGAQPGLKIGAGDRFFAYVYLDPKDPPSNVTLQWYANEGWHYRAYWGEDTIPWDGLPRGSSGHMPAGKLPPTGVWTRLEIPAEKMTLKPGDVITGWAYMQDRGTVYWDHSGIVSSVPQAGLKGTPLPTLADAPLTAEVWVRINPAKPRTWLLGNIVFGGQHPAVPMGVMAGWALSYAHGWREGNGPEQSGLTLHVGAKGEIVPKTELDGAWHHVAVCREPDKSDMVYRLFLDGKLVQSRQVPRDPRTHSPANLCVGCLPSLPVDGTNQCEMTLNGLRLSSSARYKEAFTPQRSLESDAQTFALLDFSQEPKEGIIDVAGRSHDGRLVGPKWVGGQNTAPTQPPADFVYLDDLQETDAKIGYGRLGKHGEAGYDNRKVVFQNKPASHAISMHPAQLSFSQVTYELKGAYRAFRATAALCDAGDAQSRSPVIFKIVADDRVIWHSSPLQRTRTGEECAVNLDGVKVLRLEVYCIGLDSWGAEAAWLEPTLLKTPVEVRPASAAGPANLVYLDDLKESDSKFKWHGVGKHGARGYYFTGVNPLATFRGKVPSHAISIHTQDDDSVYVTYELKETYTTLRGTAVLLEAGRPPATQVIFKVLGDDKLLWQSDPTGADTERPFSISVRGVKKLKLEVECPGSSDSVHAAWLNVALVKASSEGVAKEKPPRLPIPKDAELDAARRRVRDLFRADIEEATTPAKKEALAKKLLERAQQGREPPAVLYALLDEARETAIGAPDVDSAVKASEKLAAAYDLDGAANLLDALTQLSAATLTPEKRKALVEAVLAAAEHAASEENFKAAENLLALAAKAVAKVSDNDLRRRATFVRERVEQAHAWWEEAEKARLVLAQMPDDPAASKAVGKYLCFANEDWENGLPYLAKSDDLRLKAVAALELGSPDSPAKQATVGHAWWDQAQPATGYAKFVLQKRAQHWYLLAVEGLKEPEKGTVEKRLATLEKAVGEAAGETSAAVVAKRIVGDFFAMAASKKGKKLTTLGFAADGTFSDSQLPVGRWTVEAGQVRITYDDKFKDQGSVLLRGRANDAFTGQQTLAAGDTLNWDLRRVVPVSTWEVFDEKLAAAGSQRLVLYSNGKLNDIYGPSTWGLAGNVLSLDWKDFRRAGANPKVKGGAGLQASFPIQGNAFRGTVAGRTYRGQRVANAPNPK